MSEESEKTFVVEIPERYYDYREFIIPLLEGVRQASRPKKPNARAKKAADNDADSAGVLANEIIELLRKQGTDAKNSSPHGLVILVVEMVKQGRRGLAERAIAATVKDPQIAPRLRKFFESLPDGERPDPLDRWPDKLRELLSTPHFVTLGKTAASRLATKNKEGNTDPSKSFYVQLRKQVERKSASGQIPKSILSLLTASIVATFGASTAGAMGFATSSSANVSLVNWAAHQAQKGLYKFFSSLLGKAIAAIVALGIAALMLLSMCLPALRAPELLPDAAAFIDGGSAPVDSGHNVVVDCEGKPPAERRHCYVGRADFEEQSGRHPEAIELYKTAIAITYQDDELKREEQQEIAQLTQNDPRTLRQGFWKIETEDIWDRLAAVLWHAKRPREAADAYQKVIDLCSPSSTCELHQCTLLRFLRVGAGESVSIRDECNGGNSDISHHLSWSYANGRVAEAVGQDESAVIWYARQRGEFWRSPRSGKWWSPPIDVIRRWQEFCPLDRFMPLDTPDRYQRAIMRLIERGHGLRQGRVFVFATAERPDRSDLTLWVTIIDPTSALALSCPKSEIDPSKPPPFFFGFMEHDRPFDPGNAYGIGSIPLADMQLAPPEHRRPRTMVTTRFLANPTDPDSGCIALEDQIDVCIDDQRFVRPAPACK